ncbi:methicillin resistance protein [Bifidobacterium aemilianum]|uniref:Methicillin resistance protein n=1 Tax=Bifidobacterium aemilianum TaxID=2493120 RepID=A0A366K621_9BIFI|nr:peptidoglycan bridge formation glycyltransferase FemA/FemB family protein [Bifidobacterium aemilianum]RBP97185.1 methicillin resistance protein [Bifidobacterium aemilianum]
MPVIQADDTRIEQYEEYVSTAPFTSVTQSVGWGRVKSNWKAFYVYIEEDGFPLPRARAAMSLLVIDGFAYASKGPVGADFNVDTLDALVAEALPTLRDEGCFLLRVDPEVAYSDELNSELEAHGYRTRNRNLPEAQAHATIQPRFNVVLDLDGKHEDDLLMSFRSKTRYNVRLAARKGVTVQRGSGRDYIDRFYETYEVMSQRHGISYRARDYFDRMADTFGEDELGVYLASVDDEIIAGAVNFEYGDKSWYMYGGSANAKRNYMAPYLLQWEMIRHALTTGRKRYDFGGIFGFDDSDGLFKFKRGFSDNHWVEYIGEIDYVLDEPGYQRFLNK